MRVCYFLRMAILGGAACVLVGQPARAGSNRSVSFVQLLLLKETRLIRGDQFAIANQEHGERLLGLLSTVIPRTAKQAHLLRSDLAAIKSNGVLLQGRIGATTSSLLSLRSHLSSMLAGLGNPERFTGLASSNASIISGLAARPPFGIPPVTASQ